MSTAPQSETEKELAKLPPAVLEAYYEAMPALESAFGQEEMALWAKEGLAIGTQTVRSWESAVEYYRVCPEVARFLSFPSFMQWARCGTYLAQDSPTLAVAFFRASSSIVPNLRPQYIPRWAGLGRSLYKGTWKSSTLASKFFEVRPGICSLKAGLTLRFQICTVNFYKPFTGSARPRMQSVDVLSNYHAQFVCFFKFKTGVVHRIWFSISKAFPPF